MNKLNVNSSPQIYYLLSHHNPHSSYFRDIINNHEFLIKKLYQPGDLILVEENWNEKKFKQLKIPNLTNDKYLIKGWDEVNLEKLNTYVALKYQTISSINIIKKIDEYLLTYHRQDLRSYLFKEIKTNFKLDLILKKMMEEIEISLTALKKHSELYGYELLVKNDLTPRNYIKNSYMHAYGYLGTLSFEIELPHLTWSNIKKYLNSDCAFSSHIENRKTLFFEQIGNYLTLLRKKIISSEFSQRQDSLLQRIQEALQENPNRKIFALMGSDHGNLATTPYTEVVAKHYNLLPIVPTIVNVEDTQEVIKHLQRDACFSKEQ